MYVCALSYENKKPIPGDIIMKMNDNYSYCYGYLVALTVFEEDKIEINVSSNPLSSVVIRYDEEFFGKKDEIKNKIEIDFKNKDNVEDLRNLLQEINQYLKKTESNETK